MTSIIFVFILVDLSVIVIYLACYSCIYLFINLLICYLRINYQRAASHIGGFHAISEDTNNNGEMNKCWWTNKAS